MHTVFFYLELFLIFLLLFSGKTLFSEEPVIDVIIPCAEKDIETLDLCIKGIKKHCQNVRRIIVISSKRLSQNAEWFDESLFPFNKQDISMSLKKPCHLLIYKKKIPLNSRVNWYFQQLLKLYSLFVIPDISKNLLVVDADTIFLNSVFFIDEKNSAYYATDKQFHVPYFTHIQRLTDGKIERIYKDHSGICHHMLFQKQVMEALFSLVENIHQKPFWKAFCESISKNQVNKAGASEYEIYFNFIFSNFSHVKIQKLLWKEISDLEKIEEYQKKGYHFVTCHDWLRKKSRSSNVFSTNLGRVVN